MTKQLCHQVVPSWKMIRWANKKFKDLIIYLQRGNLQQGCANQKWPLVLSHNSYAFTLFTKRFFIARLCQSPLVLSHNSCVFTSFFINLFYSPNQGITIVYMYSFRLPLIMEDQANIFQKQIISNSNFSFFEIWYQSQKWPTPLQISLFSTHLQQVLQIHG